MPVFFWVGLALTLISIGGFIWLTIANRNAFKRYMDNIHDDRNELTGIAMARIMALVAIAAGIFLTAISVRA